MSLKSFDKFCETLITAEPGSQKVILDERQKQIRIRTAVEALLIYGVATLLNTIIMEELYQWCDSFYAPMMLLMIICYFYWLLRCHFSGALFGINGVGYAKWTAFFLMISTISLFVSNIDDAREEGFFHNGMVTDQLLGLVSFGMLFICAFATFIFARKSQKAESFDNSGK